MQDRFSLVGLYRQTMLATIMAVAILSCLRLADLMLQPKTMVARSMQDAFFACGTEGGVESVRIEMAEDSSDPQLSVVVCKNGRRIIFGSKPPSVTPSLRTHA